MTAAKQPLVRCERVSRVFGSGGAAVVALRDVRCQVQPGDLIVVTGPSGSGKSTLLHLLGGLDGPTAGTVSWPGLGSGEQPPRGSVGIVFQGPSLLPPLDVLENVALAPLLGGVEAGAAIDRASAALDALGLAELSGKLPEELSGGQAQRVAVARTLAGRPRLILADEPTGQLDQASGQHVLEALLEAATSTGAALVVSTHDRRVAERFTMHWPMEDGQLVPGGRE